MDRHLFFPCLKRVLCVLCAVVVCLTALPNAALAQEDYSYTYPDDYTGVIDPSVPYDPLLEPSNIPPEEWHTGNTSQSPRGFGMFSSSGQMVPASYSYPRVLLSTSGTSVDVVFFGNYCLYDNLGQAVLTIVPRTVYTFAATGSQVALSSGGALLYSATQFDVREHTPPEGQNKNYFTLSNTAHGVNLSYYGSLSVHYNSGLKLVNRVYIDDYLCGVVPNEIGDGFGAAALGAQAVAARNYAYNKRNLGSYYDLVDTTKDQVYKGINSAINTPAAVAATNGQILYYGSSPLQNIYYGASNGGVTELTCHRWTVDHTYPEYVEIVADPYDLKYSKNYGSNSYLEEITVTQAGDNKGMLKAMLKNVLGLTDTEAGTIQISAVTLSADCLHNINFIDREEKARNFAGFQEIYREVKGSDATYCSQFSTLTAMVSGTYTIGGITYPLPSEAIAISEKILVNGNFGFKNSDLSCFWLVDHNDGTYTVRSGRYGHGIGMSQIGARQMGAEGKSAEFILTYYYPNTTLAVSSEYTPAEALTAPPTTLSNDARTVASDSFVYATANANSIRLGIAKAGSALTVTGESGDFFAVNYSVGQGYVLKTAFTPVYGKIKIVNVTTSCNVRNGPSTSYGIIGAAPKGVEYALLDMNGAPGWYKINFNGSNGYVSANYADLVANTPDPITTYPIKVTQPAGFTDTILWVDGVPAYTTTENGMLTAEVYTNTAKTVMMYQYDSQRLPTDSYMWTLAYDATLGYTATALPDLHDLLSYQGCAIRVMGVTGLRFISGIDENLRSQLLTTAGVGGYRLKEYGTVGINGEIVTYYPFTKGTAWTVSSISYDSKNDISIDKQNGRIWYASVMTNIPVESYKTEQGFRAYAVLERSGVQYTFYGPQIARSLYYVAKQVMAANEFAEGTDAYAFVKGIIDAADAGGEG